MLPAVICDRSITCVLSVPCAADRTGQYVRQLLEPAFSTVPAAADIPTLFRSALHMSGTLPFPVPDVFYKSQWMQDDDMKLYLAPVSQSGAVAFSSMIHAVLYKNFPVGTDMVQAGQSDLHVWSECWHTTRLVMCSSPIGNLCGLLWCIGTLFPCPCIEEVVLACRAL